MNSPTPIIGVSKQILKIKELIDHVADTCLNIVITGETGVGKEVVAQALYLASPRSSNAFVKVNCAALPETLLESELYGYEKGAFTGAQKKRRGKFQMAHKGVLFLDEIGDMPFSLQSKILHVLQSGEFTPLGSDQDFQTDAWVIAATNHHLEEKIKQNEFREDLSYRLNIIKIDIPPLYGKGRKMFPPWLNIISSGMPQIIPAEK
ncbi:MAG: sigma-54 factor interaction domain-containing protein [Thermodesulfobacteriota bacterium]|nr:sigma-54 factor interaction domain-containing protein [Thermodesulfobacteriota bacterium]